MPDYRGGLARAPWSDAFRPTLLASDREEVEQMAAAAALTPCALTAVSCSWRHPRRVIRYEIWPAASPRHSDGCCLDCLRAMLGELR